MKAIYKFQTILVFLLLAGVATTKGATITWLGSVSTSWNEAGNWNSGVPDSTDNIIINSNAPYNLTLTQNLTVTNFTINGDTIDLGTYTLTTTGVTYFNGGKVQNGTLNISGSLCHFGGGILDVTISANCGYYHMNGGIFKKPTNLISSGSASTSGTGNCVFEDSLSITHSGTVYFTMGSTSGDSYQNLTITNHSTHEVYIGSSDTTFISGNLVVNNTSTGGVVTGFTGGVTYLATGKTISVGGSGFSNNYLTLKNFYQQGSTAQTLTLTGSAILNLINANFEGNLTVTSPGILLKNSTFNGTTSITRNGTSGSFHCDGGNLFSGPLTLDNAGSSGRIRMANTTPDTYLDDVTFNSSGGQDVQIAYYGNNNFSGDLTILSNKVVFNTSNGKVTFAGGNSQTLNGSYNYPFKKLAINKTGGYVTSNATFSVDDTLFFIKGSFITKSTNELTLKLNSKVVGASDSSYVQGPVKKIGNTAFVFPTGANNSYRPIEISAPSTTTSEFVGEFIEDSVPIHTVQRDSTLGFLIRNKYWKLNRTSGSSQIYVTLSWNVQNALVDTFVNVASWNGSQWNNLGKGNVYGSKSSGSIKSTSVATNYNEFILGYFSNNYIPNPVPCGAVSNAGQLVSCLTFPPSVPPSGLAVISVVDNIFVDDNGSISFPLMIQSGTTLQSDGPKWWEFDCPIVSTNHVATLIPGTTIDQLYFFQLQEGAILQNLRIRGPHPDYKDFNDGRVLSGGIYVAEGGTSPAIIRNCEISSFSQSGIWKDDEPELLTIENCYIHKVKGRNDTGIGYGSWIQGVAANSQSTLFTNTIYDDCKAAIDGQGYPSDWTINKCTFSQFFLSEDINKHNDNRFRTYHVNNGTVFTDYHYCYEFTLGACSPNCFYGPLCIPSPDCSTFACTSADDYEIDWIDCPTDGFPIPIYDIGGGNTDIISCIFHKSWKINQNGNINLTYPNRDPGENGHIDHYVNIENNTFATQKFEPVDLIPLNNKGGYARIADNYIEACVWDNSTSNISKPGNFFSYSPGKSVTSSAPQPCEIFLSLQNSAGSAVLPSSFTPSPYEKNTFIQYVDVNTAFKINSVLTGGSLPYYIFRNNPNQGSGITSTNFISNENYFFQQEEISSTGSTNFTYDKPGLYGIDVLGFDATDINTDPIIEEYDFRASSWQHIPIIVKDDTEEQVLYFNIKDSYKSDVAIDVYKEVRLNNVVIWRAPISDGGQGWEYVKVDLKTAYPGSSNSIKSLINTNGDPNLLSFDIYTDAGVTKDEVIGLSVWVDNVYIKKSNSAKGDNLISDGSIELGGIQGLGSDFESDNHWFSNGTPASYTCAVITPSGTNTSTINTDVSINGSERKSGSYALHLNIPPLNECNALNPYSDEIVVSIGTKIDFTDLLSCDDYSDQGFIPFPDGPYETSTPNPVPGTKYYLDKDIELTGTEHLVLAGCQVVIEPDILITVNSGTTLEIKDDGSTASHLFTCNGMWKGIINDGGTVKIMPSGTYPTKIEHAEQAIMSDGGILQIRYAEFDHNYIGITLANGNFDYGSASEGLFGIKFKCTDGVISRGSFAGMPSLAHIQLENVTGVEIGSSGGMNGAYKNEFSNAIYGILSHNSSAVIKNNYFKDFIKEYNSCADCGFGIRVTNSTNSNRVVEIGGDGTFEKNTFTNVNKGVYAYNVCKDCSLYVSSNSFNNTDYKYSGPGNFYNTAISVQNPISFSRLTPLVVEIKGNIITDYRIGIHGENIPNLKIFPDALDIPNRINFNLGETPSISDEHIGIFLQNCHGAFIKGDFNPAASSNIANIKNNSVATGTPLFKGIDITTSVNCRINCNFIENIPISMRFFDNCNGTILRQNNMTEYDVAVQLDNAEIGTQKQVNTSNLDEPANNYWFDDSGSNRVGGSTSSGNPIQWFYDDVTNTGELIPNPANPFVVDPEPDSPPGSVDCDDISSRIGRDELFGKTVDDSLEFNENVNENSYLAKVKAFEAMKNDSTIIFQSTSRDSAYFDFYNLIRTSNIALFDSVLTLAKNTSTLSNAISLNAAITDTNDLEYYRKSVNAVYLNTIAQNLPLDASDSSFCDEVSDLPYHVAGDAIFTAAVMIGKEIHPQSISARMMNIENQQLLPQPIIHAFNIVPNPANSFFQIRGKTDELELIQIISSDGKTIREFRTSLNLDLPVEDLKPGIYYVKLCDKSGTFHFLKLVLLR